MRVTFLVLVLANLGFAAWHAWYSEPVVVTRPMRSEAPVIRLFAESGASKSATQPGLSNAIGEPADTGFEQRRRELFQCISIGPISNRDAVDAAVRTLSAGGFNSAERASQGEAWLGRWVYIDAIETQAEAAEIVAVLVDGGIDEAYVIADANNGNIVSLGVFSEVARAQQRFAEAQALGYSASITDRSEPGEVYWLDVTVPGEALFSISDLPELSITPEPVFDECSTDIVQ